MKPQTPCGHLVQKSFLWLSEACSAHQSGTARGTGTPNPTSPITHALSHPEPPHHCRVGLAVLGLELLWDAHGQEKQLWPSSHPHHPHQGRGKHSVVLISHGAVALYTWLALPIFSGPAERGAPLGLQQRRASASSSRRVGTGLIRLRAKLQRNNAERRS